MLYVVSGLPGNGKTLYTLNTVEERRQRESREVYYSGIKGLTLGWKALTSRGGWQEVPDGSIVVIDEAYEVFPIRKQGSQVPENTELLATHRHRGLDIYLVTQDAKKQLDTFVRALVGKHFHLVRKFGMEYSSVYEWERLGDVGLNADKAEAQMTRWTFPKESFGWYTSAVEHTHGRNLPWKKIGIFVFAIVGAVGAMTYAFHVVRTNNDKTAAKIAPTGAAGSALPATPAARAAEYWGSGQVPRLKSVAQSAPIYDALQVARSQPRVEGCMQLSRGMAIECECTGPNHALLALPTDRCVELVRRGWFDETRPYADVKAQSIAYLNSLEASGASASAGEGSGDGAATSRPAATGAGAGR